MPLSEDSGIVLESSSGYLLAHDLVEHQNGFGAIGSVGDELMALGGMWYTRGHWGDFANTRMPPETVMAYDVCSLFTDWIEKDWGMPLPKVGRSEFRDDFVSIMAVAYKSISEHPEDYDNTLWPSFSKYALRFICKGAAKAHRRFGSTLKANRLYHRIRQAVQVGKLYMDWEGQELLLGYSEDRAYISELSVNY
jgi:hypothetical protein